jgi:hypothetical protein
MPHEQRKDLSVLCTANWNRTRYENVFWKVLNIKANDQIEAKELEECMAKLHRITRIDLSTIASSQHSVTLRVWEDCILTYANQY